MRRDRSSACQPELCSARVLAIQTDAEYRDQNGLRAVRPPLPARAEARIIRKGVPGVPGRRGGAGGGSSSGDHRFAPALAFVASLRRLLGPHRPRPRVQGLAGYIDQGRPEPDVSVVSR